MYLKCDGATRRIFLYNALICAPEVNFLKLRVLRIEALKDEGI